MISVDYSITPWLITIPKSDLTLSTGTQYFLTVDTFWLLLRDYADSEESIPFPVIYKRLPASSSTPSITTVSEDYYGLQFENGLYSVNIINGNTNIREVEVKNQVSVNTNNTTGFIDPVFLEAMLFPDGIVLDVVNGVPGTGNTSAGAVIGTPQTPSNNLDDAKIIATDRGYRQILVIGNTTFISTDVLDNLIIKGEGSNFTKLTFATGISTNNTTFNNAYLTGTISGSVKIQECSLYNLYGIGGTSTPSQLYKCEIVPGVVGISSSNDKDIVLVGCYSFSTNQVLQPTLNINGSLGNVSINGQMGLLSIINITQPIDISLDFISGNIDLDNTNTAGEVIIRGVYTLVDNTAGTVITRDTNVDELEYYDANRSKVDDINKTLTIFKPDGTTVHKEFDLKDNTGSASVTNIFERLPK